MKDLRALKLQNLCHHPWYEKLVHRLEEHEFDVVVAFVDDYGDLSDDEFATKVLRLGLDPEWKRHKNEAIMADLLLACKDIASVREFLRK